MEARQILVVHQAIWDEMESFAQRKGFRLDRVPDGADDDGRLFFSDDPDVIPTYAFMPGRF